MDFLKNDVIVNPEVTESNVAAAEVALSDIHLALVGGGVGEVVFG